LLALGAGPDYAEIPTELDHGIKWIEAAVLPDGIAAN
jgi:hypothetical protein